MKSLLCQGAAKPRCCVFAAIVAILLVAVSAVAQNAVTDWNAIGITQARASMAPGSATPGGTGVYLAYVELAVYNAVVAIDHGYHPYKYHLSAPKGASPDAAAVEAAYRMLLYLLPDRTSDLDAAYTASLAAIPDGDAKEDGKAVGLASAEEMISLRSGDGRGGPYPYTFPSSPVPGVWILTPGVTAPVTPWLGHMRPFTFEDPARYFPDEAPPALNSWRWAEDYNLTKLWGAINSPVRTPAQTEIGLFWTDHPGSQYGAMLRLLVAQQNLNLVESARLMAVSYSAMADGIIGCFNAKYTFSFWRPVTAIRNGDIDGNPNTVPDPSWTPLGTTPGHPEYPSAHGCVSGALADALEGYFGTTHVHLTVSSVVTNTTHNFSDLRDLKREVFWARIYAGFHYHHSMVQGFLLGHKVAHHITHNYFEPTRKHKEHH
jgi:PAP2 superfamily